MKETIISIQKRWVEFKEPRDYITIFQYSSHFNGKFLEKVEDVLVELVETFSQENKAKVYLDF